MKLSRRMLLGGIALFPFSARARAAQWPSGSIRIISPFPPGGSVDAVARLLAAGLQTQLGTTVIVENISGASGSIGTAAAARATPDGNTWMLAFDTHAVNPFLIDKLPYDTKADLAPVFLLGTAPNVLATHPSRPFKTFADVVEAAKQAPERITYATTGAGTLGHLAVVQLTAKAGIKLTHVPYKGGGPAMTDALGGQVDLIIGSTALITPQVRAQKLRPIVQTGRERVSALGDVQTAIEAGFPDMEAYSWWGLFAPSATPPAVVERVIRELREVLKDAAAVKQLTEVQQMTLVQGGPEQLKAFVDQQMEIWGKVIKENNIKINS